MAVLTEFRGATGYSDSYWSGLDVVIREQELRDHWGKMTANLKGFSVGNILDIGPGGGAQTRLLQSLYPQASITAVDIDVRAEKAAENNGIEVVSLDLAALRSPERIERLMRKKKINTVVALRTSEAVAINLINWWEKTFSSAFLAFSSNISFGFGI